MSEKLNLGALRKPQIVQRSTPTAPSDLEEQILGKSTVEGEDSSPAKPQRDRKRKEPKVVVTFQLEYSLDEALEERASALGIKKRDIIARGIQLALADPEFQL
jgi:hypothetical protein